MTRSSPFSSTNVNGVFIQTSSSTGAAPPRAVHFTHRRSILAACSQYTGSRAAVAGDARSPSRPVIEMKAVVQGLDRAGRRGLLGIGDADAAKAAARIERTGGREMAERERGLDILRHVAERLRAALERRMTQRPRQRIAPLRRPGFRAGRSRDGTAPAATAAADRRRPNTAGRGSDRRTHAAGCARRNADACAASSGRNSSCAGSAASISPAAAPRR